MTTTTMTRRTELAHRTSDGIDVYLFWNQPGNHVTISVVDTRNDDRFELEVDACHALDGFNHPYAYAASSRTDRLSALSDALAASRMRAGAARATPDARRFGRSASLRGLAAVAGLMEEAALRDDSSEPAGGEHRRHA